MRTAQNHNVLVESKVSTFEFLRNYKKKFQDTVYLFITKTNIFYSTFSIFPLLEVYQSMSDQIPITICKKKQLLCTIIYQV